MERNRNPYSQTTMSESNNSNSDLSSPSGIADDISIREFWDRYLFPHWKKYCVAAFAGGVLFVAISFVVARSYTATVNAQANVGDSSSLRGGNLGSLASLAGVNLNGANSNVAYNMSFVSSRDAADAFITKYDLSRELMAETADDKSDDRRSLSRERVYRRFSRVFSITASQRELSLGVQVQWKDPAKAEKWANDYVTFINGYLKEKAIAESNLKIRYLKSLIAEDPPVEVQKSIYSIIEEELKRIAMAEASDEYAFKIVQHAYLPERKSSPKRLYYLLFGMILGVGAVFCHVVRTSRKV
jgi:uncharacterized protein involved in exopolysaccharide biosynthesis